RARYRCDKASRGLAATARAPRSPENPTGAGRGSLKLRAPLLRQDAQRRQPALRPAAAGFDPTIVELEDVLGRSLRHEPTADDGQHAHEASEVVRQRAVDVAIRIPA